MVVKIPRASRGLKRTARPEALGGARPAGPFDLTYECNFKIKMPSNQRPFLKLIGSLIDYSAFLMVAEKMILLFV